MVEGPRILDRRGFLALAGAALAGAALGCGNSGYGPPITATSESADESVSSSGQRQGAPGLSGCPPGTSGAVVGPGEGLGRVCRRILSLPDSEWPGDCVDGARRPDGSLIGGGIIYSGETVCLPGEETEPPLVVAPTQEPTPTQEPSSTPEIPTPTPIREPTPTSESIFVQNSSQTLNSGPAEFTQNQREEEIDWLESLALCGGSLAVSALVVLAVCLRVRGALARREGVTTSSSSVIPSADNRTRGRDSALISGVPEFLQASKQPTSRALKRVLEEAGFKGSGKPYLCHDGRIHLWDNSGMGGSDSDTGVRVDYQGGRGLAMDDGGKVIAGSGEVASTRVWDGSGRILERMGFRFTNRGLSGNKGADSDKVHVVHHVHSDRRQRRD